MLLPHPKRHRDLPNIFKRETSSYLTGPRPIVDVLPESRPFHQGDGLLCPKPCCAGRSETELCGVWTELSVPASSNLCFQNNRARDVCESSAQNRAREQADRRQDRCVRLQPRTALRVTSPGHGSGGSEILSSLDIQVKFVHIL